MGKKKTTIIGSENEEELKAKKAAKLEQKKLREGKKTETPVGADLGVSPTTHHPVESSVAADLRVSHPEEGAAAKPTKSKKAGGHRSKAYKSARKQISEGKTYSLVDGLSLLHSVSLTKFDPTVELHIVLKKAPETKLSVTLPHSTATGKKVILADDAFVKALETNTADLNVDYIVATPAQMSKLVRFAKVLGPKGLMPNPKTGTVTERPEEVAKRLASDTSVALKLDKTGPIIHMSVGKLSLGDDKLSENIKHTLAQFTASNLKKVVLKSTMSPAIKIQA